MEAVAAGLGVAKQWGYAGGAGEAVDGVAIAPGPAGITPEGIENVSKTLEAARAVINAPTWKAPAGCGRSGLGRSLGTLTMGAAHVDGERAKISILSDAVYALPLELR